MPRPQVALVWVLMFLLLPVSLRGQASPQLEIPCVRAPLDSLRPDLSAVFRHCDVDVAARRRSAPRPSFEFPRELLCGIVELEFVVGTDGVPVDSTALVLSTNSPDFARAVVHSLRRWRFRPAQLRGTPVAQRVRERYALATHRVPFVVSSQSSSQPARPSPAPECK